MIRSLADEILCWNQGRCRASKVSCWFTWVFHHTSIKMIRSLADEILCWNQGRCRASKVSCWFTWVFHLFKNNKVEKVISVKTTRGAVYLYTRLTCEPGNSVRVLPDWRNIANVELDLASYYLQRRHPIGCSTLERSPYQNLKINSFKVNYFRVLEFISICHIPSYQIGLKRCHIPLKKEICFTLPKKSYKFFFFKRIDHLLRHNICIADDMNICFVYSNHHLLFTL